MSLMPMLLKYSENIVYKITKEAQKPIKVGPLLYPVLVHSSIYYLVSLALSKTLLLFSKEKKNKMNIFNCLEMFAYEVTIEALC